MTFNGFYIFQILFIRRKYNRKEVPKKQPKKQERNLPPYKKPTKDMSYTLLNTLRTHPINKRNKGHKTIHKRNTLDSISWYELYKFCLGLS